MSDPGNYLELLSQHSKDKAHRIENGLCCLRMTQDVAPFSSVVDFGCGIGAWLYAARELGAARILGLEGAWINDAETVIDRRHIQIADLAVEPPNFQKGFDLALSIEVAEHLPESAADDFCNALTQASDRILFSAARKNQGGHGHVNEQDLPYWIEKFWARGFVPLETHRPFFADNKQIFWWLRQNLVMFVSYAALIRSDRLLRFARPLSNFEWPTVRG